MGAGKDFLESVGLEVWGAGKRWWRDNRAFLEQLGEQEAKAVLEALRHGDRVRAKLEVVARMTPEEWAAYRDGTTGQLREIAQARAKLLAALERLGWLAAFALKRAVLAAVRKGAKGRA